ncbi:17681_t:CDS:2, partial [Racocetra fulgida]
RMCPLEYDLFGKIHHLMGVTPDFFELVLMGFESVFGGVTCLPGCFCMYRLKARKGENDWVPIITKPEIVQEYSQNIVDTLHQKNLLLLGEDRFLTTLMLRNFPHRKMMFCPQALCKTVVPDEFRVLLSQRRLDGETKGDDHGKKEGQFDASKVPLKRWEDWERSRIRRERRNKERQLQASPVPPLPYNNTQTLTVNDNTRLLRNGRDDTYYSETASNHSSSPVPEVEQPTQFYDYNLTQQLNPAQPYSYQQEQYNYNIRNDRRPYGDQYSPDYRQEK